MSLFAFLGIFLFLFLPKSHGDGGMVTAAGVGWRWESLAMILHVSGTSKMVVCELSGGEVHTWSCWYGWAALFSDSTAHLTRGRA